MAIIVNEEGWVNYLYYQYVRGDTRNTTCVCKVELNIHTVFIEVRDVPTKVALIRVLRLQLN